MNPRVLDWRGRTALAFGKTQTALAFGKTLRFISQTANLMCGVPDYATYVAHRKARHPDEPIMSETEFFRERQKARYADGSGRGCRCC